MNRKTLIKLTTLAATALCGWASAASAQNTADPGPAAVKDVSTARAAWTQCVRTAILKLDDSLSPSDVIARAAMKGCTEQYAAVTQALQRTLTPSCTQDPNCTRQALETAQRDAAKAATDEVMAARVRVAGAQVLICQ